MRHGAKLLRYVTYAPTHAIPFVTSEPHTDDSTAALPLQTTKKVLPFTGNPE